MPTPAGGWQVGRPSPAGRRTPASTCASATRPSRFGSTPSSGPKDGDSDAVPLGDDRATAMTSASAPLPEQRDGGLLTALVFRNPARRRAPATRTSCAARRSLRGPRRAGRRRTRSISRSSRSSADHHPGAAGRPTACVLPAIVSPDLAGDGATPTARSTCTSASGTIPLRVVGVGRPGADRRRRRARAS